MPSYPQYLEAAAAARRVAGVWNLQNHLEVVLPAGNYRDDATLTITANDALTLNVAVPDGVEATTSNGDITLTGTVNYGSERTAAEQAVTYLTGVRNVRDDIGISTDADPVDVTLNAQDALVPARSVGSRLSAYAEQTGLATWAVHWRMRSRPRPPQAVTDPRVCPAEGSHAPNRAGSRPLRGRRKSHFMCDACSPWPA